MSAHRDFLLAKYSVQGTRFVIAATIHVPSPSEWFHGIGRDALLLELQEELIQHHARFSSQGEGQPQFEFLITARMKVIYRAEKSRLRHVVLMNREGSSPFRSHDCELVLWLYPLDADIPIDFIRI